MAKTLTKDQTRRIIEAIAECDRFIAIEAPRAADTRPEWAAKTLAHYQAHRVKLTAMLEAAPMWTPESARRRVGGTIGT